MAASTAIAGELSNVFRVLQRPRKGIREDHVNTQHYAYIDVDVKAFEKGYGGSP